MKLPRAHHLKTTELAAQMLLVRTNFGFHNRDHPETGRVLQMLKRQPAGWQFTGLTHPADVRYWTGLLDRESRYPQIFAADVNGGLNDVLLHATGFPAAALILNISQGEFATEVAEAIAKEARSVGFNLLFYPEITDDITATSAIIAAMTDTIRKFGIAAFVKCAGVLPQELNMSQYPSGLLYSGKVSDIANVKKAVIRVADWEIQSEPAGAGAANLRQLIEDGVSMLRVQYAAFGEVLTILTEVLENDPAAKSNACRAVDRLFRLKKWLHKHKPGQIHPQRIYRVIGHPGHLALAKKIANARQTPLKN